MVVSSLTDKALIERAREGDAQAAAVLFRRWNVAPKDDAAVMAGFKKLTVLSVSAAKRIAKSH